MCYVNRAERVRIGGNMKKHFVRIAWGSESTREENEGKFSTYTFDTEAELNAFLKGIDEAIGWDDYFIDEDKG